MKASKKPIKKMNALTPSEMNEIKGGKNYVRVVINGEVYYIEIPWEWVDFIIFVGMGNTSGLIFNDFIIE